MLHGHFNVLAFAAAALLLSACADTTSPTTRQAPGGALFQGGSASGSGSVSGSGSGSGSGSKSTPPPSTGCESITGLAAHTGTNFSSPGLIQARASVASTCTTISYFSVEFRNVATGQVESVSDGWVGAGFKYSLNMDGGLLPATTYLLTLTTYLDPVARTPIMDSRTLTLTTP